MSEPRIADDYAAIAAGLNALQARRSEPAGAEVSVKGWGIWHPYLFWVTVTGETHSPALSPLDATLYPTKAEAEQEIAEHKARYPGYTAKAAECFREI